MCNIAIVDDDPDLLFLLKVVVESDGHRVAQFESVDEFLEAEPGWDLVVTDLAMPGASGLDLIQQMREAGDQTPVVVVSALGDEATIRRAYQAGADEYLIKPFKPVNLSRAIWRLLPNDPPEHVEALHDLFEG